VLDHSKAGLLEPSGSRSPLAVLPPRLLARSWRVSVIQKPAGLRLILSACISFGVRQRRMSGWKEPVRCLSNARTELNSSPHAPHLHRAPVNRAFLLSSAPRVREPLDDACK